MVQYIDGTQQVALASVSERYVYKTATTATLWEDTWGQELPTLCSDLRMLGGLSERFVGQQQTCLSTAELPILGSSNHCS